MFALLTFAGIAGVLFLWGTVAPRSAWRVLVGWTRPDARRGEPTRPGFAVGRLLSAIGLVMLAATTVGWSRGAPPFDDPPVVAETVWGSPAPVLVDRVLSPLPGPPEGLIAAPIDGYQPVDDQTRQPAYLFDMDAVRDGAGAPLGLIGTVPAEGTAAVDTADAVVHVVVDRSCVPQQAVLVLTDQVVQFAVYVAPSPSVDCAVAPTAENAVAYLVPFDLGAPLGLRAVQALDGAPLTVRAPTP